MLPLDETSVDAAVIAPMVHDFLEKLTADTMVWTARNYGKNPNRRRFHRGDCRYKPSPTIQTDISSCERRGVKPCAYCMTDVRTHWAHQLGFPRHFVDDLCAGKIRRLSSDYAVRLLEGIGEKPHPDLIRKRNGLPVRSGKTTLRRVPATGGSEGQQALESRTA